MDGSGRAVVVVIDVEGGEQALNAVRGVLSL